MADPDRSAARGGGRDREPASTSRAGEEGRLWVEVAGVRRPFMRGILVHSLQARGVPFEDANTAANAVRARLRPKGVVSKADIVAELQQLLDPAILENDPVVAQKVDITVHGKDGSQPFSKGVLSQSLLAAAIEPNLAFEVARDIENELLRRGRTSVDRMALRRLTYEVASRRAGPRTGERYLVWRHYADAERPVMLLIGGAPGVGKTTLALEVAHRLGIVRVLSTDSIRQIMRLMLSPDLAPALHGSSYDAYKYFPPDALGDDPLMEAFRAQTATVSVGVRASIERAIEENASTVIDGVALFPGTLDLAAYSERAHVVSVVLATLDADALGARFTSRASGQRGRLAQRYLDNFEAISRVQDQFLEAAERHQVPIVDNDDLDEAVLLVIRHLVESLRSRTDFDPEDLLQESAS